MRQRQFGDNKVKATGVNAASTMVLPANCAITGIYLKNTTANAITGGLKLGTTAGGVEVVVALAIAGSFIGHVADAAILLKFFSTTAVQTIYLDAVAAWNNASVDVTITYAPL